MERETINENGSTKVAEFEGSPEPVQEALLAWQYDDSAVGTESLSNILSVASSTSFTGAFIVVFRDGYPVWVENRSWQRIIEDLPEGMIRMKI